MITVCKLCFKQHEGPCQGIMAQTLLAKGMTRAGTDLNPIPLTCPNCANYKAEIERLKQQLVELDLRHPLEITPEDFQERYINPAMQSPPDSGERRRNDDVPPKMTQSERMKLRWAAKKAAQSNK